MSRLRALWWRIAGGLWFLPSVIVVAAVLLAVGLIDFAPHLDAELVKRWPRVFGVAAEGARSMLSAIAGSMITVAGVVFSITIVALSLAASQYSPRVLKTFMADRPTQIVLGMFLGIYAYCLTVLRTIRGGDEAYVPSIAVLGGMILAFVGIGLLVYFIHHVASSINASSILSRVTAATLQGLDGLFPEDLGAPLEESENPPPETLPGPWVPALARASGYIVSVHDSGLLGFARKRGRAVRMERGIGDFVIAGRPLASLHGAEAVGAEDEAALNACYAVEDSRTIEQDTAFGVQQIVDIGAKALSPGINDPTTALLCIDRLTQLLVRLAGRRIESPLRREGSRLRVIALGPSFADLVSLACSELRDDARGKRSVLMHLLWSIEQVAAAASDPGRRRTLADEARKIAEAAQRSTAAPQDRGDIVDRARRLQSMLEGEGRQPAMRAAIAL